MTYFLLGALGGHAYLRSGLESAARDRGFRVSTSLHQIDASVVSSGPNDELIAVSGDIRQLTDAVRMGMNCTIIYIGPFVDTVLDAGWEWVNPDSKMHPAQLLSYVLGRARLKRLGVMG